MASYLLNSFTDFPSTCGSSSCSVSSEFYLYYQNVRGINNKLSNLYNSLLGCNHDVICLSQTWLISSVLNTEFCPNDFQIVRSDRNLQKMGVSKGEGDLIVIRRQYASFPLDLSSKGFDSLQFTGVVGAKCSLSHLTLYVFVIYIQPSSSADEYDLLMNLLSNLEELYKINVRM